MPIWLFALLFLPADPANAQYQPPPDPRFEAVTNLRGTFVTPDGGLTLVYGAFYPNYPPNTFAPPVIQDTPNGGTMVLTFPTTETGQRRMGVWAVEADIPEADIISMSVIGRTYGDPTIGKCRDFYIYDGSPWYDQPHLAVWFKYPTPGLKTMSITAWECWPAADGVWYRTGTAAAHATWSFNVVPVPPSFTVSPTTLNLSTGDTYRFVTTTASPATTSFTPTFTVGSQSNPNSSCAVGLNFSGNGGTGSVDTTVTAGPPDCSRIFNDVRAQVGSTASTNSTKIVIPPQIMIKMIVGEAGGQPGDTDQHAILASARNRFGDGMFPGGTTSTWQHVLIPSQYPGVSNGTTNGPNRELRNAAQIFTGEIGDIVGGTKCYWSPTYSQWLNIQAALQSATKKFPSNTGVSDCWRNLTRQIVYKASIGLNVSGGSTYANAPAFVFLRLRQQNVPAVVQIP